MEPSVVEGERGNERVGLCPATEPEGTPGLSAPEADQGENPGISTMPGASFMLYLPPLLSSSSRQMHHWQGQLVDASLPFLPLGWTHRSCAQSGPHSGSHPWSLWWMVLDQELNHLGLLVQWALCWVWMEEER